MERSRDPSIVRSMEELNMNVSINSLSDQTRDSTRNLTHKSVQTQTHDPCDVNLPSPTKTDRITSLKSKPQATTAHNAHERIFPASPSNNKPPSKRKREDSSAESLSQSISDIAIRDVNKPVTKQVTFSLQNSANEGGATNQPSTSTDQYQVINSASPIWHLALQHKTYEQRAYLRSTALKEKIDQKSPPLWCFGLDKIPEYMNPLSEELWEMMQRQAMEVAEHCYIKLIEKQLEQESIAKSHLNITKQMYDQENNDGFPKAEERLVGIIGAYRAQEKQKITNIYARDEAKKPKDTTGWLQAMSNRSALLQPAPREPSNRYRGNTSTRSGGSKRRRSNSGNRRQAPSSQRRRERSRTPERRSRTRYGGHQRNTRYRSPPKPDTPGNTALVEALRALLK